MWNWERWNSPEFRELHKQGLVELEPDEPLPFELEPEDPLPLELEPDEPLPLELEPLEPPGSSPIAAVSPDFQ